MNERPTDFELMQGFARHGDQPAFAGLVRRHLDLVYATAFRKVQDQGGAEEVAQNVFAALVRKVWQFAPEDSLPAWLHKTALLESKQWLRGELRRRRREQTAAELGTTMKTPDEQSALRALVPLLDEALLSLREKDRTALLLRFYENRPLREVGASLGVGEDAAQKRVAGALENLSAFFQRRGFKTATAAATAAALQHTATAAPASVANAVVLAAGQMTPPAMLGLTALAARLAGWSKAQVAAACLVLAAGPVAWQWRQHQAASEQVARLQTQLAGARTELSTTQTEIDRLIATSARLAAAIETAAASVRQRNDAADKFAAWKNRLRGLLTAADYRWPDDSPFVRIPKSVLRQLDVNEPVTPPGVLKPEARELLGLTPEERERAETALHRHFAAVDDLIETRIYETNRSSRVQVPATAQASKLLVVPPLGDGVQASANELQTALQNILGGERWPLVQAELQISGVGSLRQTLGLDAGKQQLEAGVWVQNENGKLVLGYGTASGSSSMASSGFPLQAFAMPGPDGQPGGNLASQGLFGNTGLSDAVTRRMKAWIEEQLPAGTGGNTK